MKFIIKTAVTIVVAIVYILFALNSFQQSNVRTMTVTGEGKGYAEPSIANAIVSIESTKDTAFSAQSSAHQKYTQFLNNLKNKSFIQDLQTISVTIVPSQSPSQKTMYTANISLGFKIIDISKVGLLIDELINIGVAKLDTLILSANETEIERATDEAINNGMKDALRKVKANLSFLINNDSCLMFNITEITQTITLPPQPISDYYGHGSNNVKSQSFVNAKVKVKVMF
ncbi:hypothetical protein ABK040_016261 [Willaertia magna]